MDTENGELTFLQGKMADLRTERIFSVHLRDCKNPQDMSLKLMELFSQANDDHDDTLKLQILLAMLKFVAVFPESSFARPIKDKVDKIFSEFVSYTNEEELRDPRIRDILKRGNINPFVSRLMSADQVLEAETQLNDVDNPKIILDFISDMILDVDLVLEVTKLSGAQQDRPECTVEEVRKIVARVGQDIIIRMKLLGRFPALSGRFYLPSFKNFRNFALQYMGPAEFDDLVPVQSLIESDRLEPFTIESL